MLKIALAVLIALAVPSAAQAAAGDKAGLLVAERTWGAAPCGTPHVEVSTPDEYVTAYGTGLFNGTPLAWADETRCAIVINRDLIRIELRTATKRCHVIVHEWGHLTGHEHSENQRSVMYGEDLVAESRVRRGKHVRYEAANAYKPCYPVTAPGFRFG